jgi:hypothetical protein
VIAVANEGKLAGIIAIADTIKGDARLQSSASMRMA